MAEPHVSGARLSAFLDDELGDDDAFVVARHVLGCPGCAGELDGLRATRDALRRLPALQAPVLTSGVEARLRWRRQQLARLRSVLLVVVVLPALVVGSLYLAGGEPPGELVPPTERFLAEHVARSDGQQVLAPVLAPAPDPAP